jgi:glycosyltransferase involved in cell wall biosynthesis
MRLLSIVPYNIFPAKMGGQKGIALFNEYLAKEIALYCITVKSNSPSYAKGYTVINQLSNNKFRYINPFYFYLIRKLIRKYSITHLLLEHSYYGWLGIALKKSCGVKLIVHSHNIESLRWKNLGKWWWKVLYWYERAIHRAADVNFFINDNDHQFAIKNYNLAAGKCTTITYGVEISKAPEPTERTRCKALVQKVHNIPENTLLLLFNGALNYLPNEEALKSILYTINPVLLKTSIAYKIIIAGKGLNPQFNELKQFQDKNIIYAGFVEDISVYFKGTDIFINPVIDGSGIKTKLVEALGFNMNAISTNNGAIGISTAITGEKLTIVENDDWIKFADAVPQTNITLNIPPCFFEHFYWGAIIKKAKSIILALTHA